MLSRPRPPEHLLGQEGTVTPTPFVPAPELEAWARATFIDDDAPLLNEEHMHLRDATLGFLWCAIPNARQMNAVVGQAEMLSLQGGKWSKARQEMQIEGWFGRLPDFLITLHADYADQCSDAGFCSLVEHELLHCGQAKDVWGQPRFSKQTGKPIFSMRGHDVEEFVSIVARYGVGNGAGQTAALVEAANRAPIVCEADIAGACGTCGRRLTII
ncbi:putative metallopeptidase [Methylobacterium brachythecii]|uniref:Putative phage metallopeptidase domain-containing protein n=1 Tax=Methylobacterium brachythecii TaxID=1176177 RepID=A0A7W6AR14_9HYPH|nr:putative metallopeptidase [Methylobacterium brachythecii]MBB3905116.1 hypothetical protein [Methylobacterium brachythecii]GLS44376.1 hypothetical protein GCM10007884_23640 [Methylobacterium brachythecii]